MAVSPRKRQCWLRKLFSCRTESADKTESVCKKHTEWDGNASTNDGFPHYKQIEEAPVQASSGLSTTLSRATTFSTAAVPFTHGFDPDIDTIRLVLDTTSLSLPPASRFRRRRHLRNTSNSLSDAVESATASSLERCFPQPTGGVPEKIEQRLAAFTSATAACFTALEDCVHILAEASRQVETAITGAATDRQLLAGACASSIVATLALESARMSTAAAAELAEAEAGLGPEPYNLATSRPAAPLAERISLSENAVAAVERVCKDAFEAASTAYLQDIQQRLQGEGVRIKKSRRSRNQGQARPMSVSVSLAHDPHAKNDDFDAYDQPCLSIAAVDRETPGASVAVSAVRSDFSAIAGRRRVVVVAAAVEPAGQGNTVTVVDASEDEFETLTRREDRGSTLTATVSVLSHSSNNISTTSASGGSSAALDLVHAVLAAIRKYGL